jgi:hypothetical protein
MTLLLILLKKKEKPELVFLVSLVFNKNTKDIYGIFFVLNKKAKNILGILIKYWGY